MTPVLQICTTSSVNSSLEPAKRLLETLKHSDEAQLLNFEQEYGNLRKKILAIDPLLLGQPRYVNVGKMRKLFYDMRYGTQKMFASKVNLKLQRLEQLNQSILSLKASISQKTSEIQRLASEILRLKSYELETQSHLKAQEEKAILTKKLYDDLHEARKAAIFEGARSRTQSISNAASLMPLTSGILPGFQEELPIHQKLPQIEPVLTKVKEIIFSKTSHEMFVDSICDELMLLEVPGEFSRLLISSLFPEVSSFVKTAKETYEITFKGNFQFNGTLSGVKATINNPLSLKIQIDFSKKTLHFEKEKYGAKTGLGNGYLAALNFNKKGSVILECLLKKGFSIPISGCYTYQEFKEAFGDIAWISC